MIQENNRILGFESFRDFLNCTFGLKTSFFNAIGALIASLTSFITSYIWNDSTAVYFMLFLIIIDAITGVWKSVIYKTFRSSKLPRVFVISLIYVLMLSLSWNSAKNSDLFIWLPGAVYGGLIGTQLISIYENLSELGYLPKGFVYELINKVGNAYSLKNILSKKEEGFKLKEDDFKNKEEEFKIREEEFKTKEKDFKIREEEDFKNKEKDFRNKEKDDFDSKDDGSI